MAEINILSVHSYVVGPPTLSHDGAMARTDLDGARQGAPISLLVCDDHRMLTDLLKMLVATHPDVCLVADPVDNAADAISLCARYQPDVVLMDIQLKGELTGVEATKRIRKVSPSTNVIIMSGSYAYEAALMKVAEAGACGFLDKAEAVDDVIGAVKAAAAGEMLIEANVLARLLRQSWDEREARREGELALARLTGREREILQLLALGAKTEDIAAKLYISLNTVHTHVQNVLRKLEVHSKLEAVAFAARHGAVSV